MHTHTHTACIHIHTYVRTYVHGSTPGFKRDFAFVLNYKASSVRNKILKAAGDGGLYKTVFVLAPEDCTEAIGRLQEKGLMVTVDKSKSGLFDEEVLKAKSMQLEELEKTYLVP